MKKAVIIPAVKKNAAFYDDLIKKIAGQSLIERVINKAKEIANDEHIYILTDSEEICLISRRKGVGYFFEKSLKLFPGTIFENPINFLVTLADDYQTLILLSPYVPLLTTKEIQNALSKYESNQEKFLVSVKNRRSRTFTGNRKTAYEILGGETGQKLLIESMAFQIIDSSLVKNEKLRVDVRTGTYALSNDLIEIQSYQDWWVCEKLLKRKRIVFRVIGDEQNGMGHIQRTLTLAHEITDHEIRFVCDTKSKIAADKLAGYDYWLGVYKPEEIEDKIITLEPDLVINDMLNTTPEYINKLRRNNIGVVNFEDLGAGASLANLTINELYDEPLISGENILWGQDYFFVREEFNDAQPTQFKEKIDSLLLMFGATDPGDYVRKILPLVKDECVKKDIKIYVVTGGGYPFIKELEREIEQISDSKIEYHHAIGVVSPIMEKVQVAISSNGRTAYELAHMNIPSIILSHHKRENTHKFTKDENGFIPIGIYGGKEIEEKVIAAFQRLTEDRDYRKRLFDRIKPFQFTQNKEKVINIIFSVLNS